jgi:hypothetical protein
MAAQLLAEDPANTARQSHKFIGLMRSFAFSKPAKGCVNLGREA